MRRTSSFASRLHQDGHTFEIEILGRCSAPYAGSIEAVRKHQPKQKTKTVVAFENEFKRRGLPVRFYTAVGTRLDHHDGIDGFFEFLGAVVTIDLTIDSNKEVAKADMVVQKGDLNNIPQLVGWIAVKLLRKLEVSH